MNATNGRMFHYTQLLPVPSDSPIAVECQTYRNEIVRLLAEGHEGKHVLIKGDKIIGIWNTDAEAYGEGLKRYLGQPFVVHQIRTWEPVLRVSRLYACPTIR